MREFDVIVIGGGSGLDVANAVAQEGMSTALIEEKALGGTCLNRGCIPSKMLLHSADIAETITRAKEFGIHASIREVDFPSIIKRVSGEVDGDSRSIEKALRSVKNPLLFKKRCEFVSERTVRVGGEVIRGREVVIAAGTRPAIPEIPGLKEAGFITSDEALRLEKQPKSMIIAGGGYIAAELAHFYGSLGTEITIIQKNELMLNSEDEEIAGKFTEIYSKKFSLFLNSKAVKAGKEKGKKFVLIEGSGKRKKLFADELLIAVGRTPNSDLLNVKKTGVEVDENGFIKTNEFLETSAENTWAFGDIAGKFLFKHSANHEAGYVINAVAYGKRREVDYSAMPHAIFSSPQVAGVGFTERELREKRIRYLTGRYNYSDTGMGSALREKDGFVKFLVEKNTDKILGCHILGPDASTLIHEVVVAMKSGEGTISNIEKAIHVHPSLSEVVQRALWELEESSGFP